MCVCVLGPYDNGTQHMDIHQYVQSKHPLGTQVGNVTHHKYAIRERHPPDRQRCEQRGQIFIACEGRLRAQ